MNIEQDNFKIENEKNDELKPIESPSPKNEESRYDTKENKKVDTKSVKEPSELTSEKEYGNYNFGYASYNGDLMNGKPHGKGRMTFTSAHTDNRLGYSAEAGDYIEGYFSNGSLDPGATLYKKDGSQKKLY